jgi:hypothetical protein
MEIGVEAHSSQADSFAVVPETTAEPSVWETERGNAFMVARCNQSRSQEIYALDASAVTRANAATADRISRSAVEAKRTGPRHRLDRDRESRCQSRS